MLDSPLPIRGSESSQEPMGNWDFSLRTFRFGLYNQACPSRATRSLHAKRFGIGKHSETKSKCTGLYPLEDPASPAAASCRCNRATSLDQLPSFLQGSFTAMSSSLFPGTCSLGREGQIGTSSSSSSSIHSGYNESHVTFFGA